MKAKDDILNLGMRFGIEFPHTTHVAELALALFDGFLPEHGLEKGDRPLLFAAAFLHDIGYASDPPNHVVEGARILAENPISAFSDKEWKIIIGTALLHKRDWRVMLEHEIFRETNANGTERMKKLAAILRIADGLDHGHLQDARITYCKRGKRVDKVGVECGWYTGNIVWAEGKADLWESIHKRPFRFAGQLHHSKKLFKGVVHKSDTTLPAARRLLYSQWCIMRDNVPGMLEGRNLECLHDYRVAMRRFRAALRFFKPVLHETAAHELNEQLRELSSRLSPVRDAHVALELLRSLEPQQVDLSITLHEVESRVAAANQQLREILQSDFCLQMVQTASRFLRVELPALENERSSPLYREYAMDHVEPMYRQIMAMGVSGLRDGDPAQMHEVRKRCRRGRYYAEFGAPTTGKEMQRMAKSLKGIAGALGDVRDARALMLLQDDLNVRTLLEKRENAAWDRFFAGWQKLVAP